MPRAYATLFVGIWGVFFSFQICIASEPTVRFQEIFYNPSGNDTGKEYIILSNYGDEIVDLTGWDIDPSSAPYITLPSATISPGAVITIHINTEGTNSATDIFFDSVSNMSNTKGPIALFSSTEHSTENLIDYLAYGEGGLANEAKAVEKQIWEPGIFIPAVQEGNALVFDGQRWHESAPTIAETHTVEEIEEVTPESGVNVAPIKLPTTSVDTQLFIPKKIIDQPPHASFSIPEIALINETIRFDATPSTDDIEILSYLWDFGIDGMSGRIADYRFATSGDFSILLTVRDKKFSATTSHTIHITDDPQRVPLSVENAVTQKLVRLSEVLPNPVGNDAEGEWLELENTSNRPINVSALQIDDKEGGGSKPYTLPDNLIIPAHSFLIIEREESGIAFNNTVDSLRLIAPDGEVLESISYVGGKEGKSYVRKNNEWHWSDSPTPGIANVSLAVPHSVSTSTFEDSPPTILHDTTWTLEGVITAEPGLFAKSYGYIALHNVPGANLPTGIQIYMQNARWPNLSQNNIVALTGTFSTSGTEPRLILHSPDSIYIEDGVGLIEPIEISIEDITDDHLGALIMVDGTVIEKSGSYFYVENEEDELRIYNGQKPSIDTTALQEGTQITATGILSKTKAGYRLMPRNDEDIAIIEVLGAVTTSPEIPAVTTHPSPILPYLTATLIASFIALVITTVRLRQRSIAKKE